MSDLKKRKVLLIGWDAADWKVINPLMDEGKMPHLEALVNEGTMGNLATLTPVLSPMLWTSIATGKRPYKHGIHGFAEPDPEKGGVRPITNLSRKTKAIWNILSQKGLKSNIIGWWPSHPAEPINGVMVSNHYHKVSGPNPEAWPMPEGTVHPPELADKLAQFRLHLSELDAQQVLPFVPKGAGIDPKKDRRLEQVARTLADCASVHACATAVMQNEPWDFMGVYYDAIDHFCHGFMRYHPPRQEHIDEESFELYKGVVESAYRFHDMMLGVTLQLAGDDTTVILMSDHGFHPDHLRPKVIPREPNGPAVEHSHLGIFVARGPGIKKDETIFGANLLDITPTLLNLFDLPVGEDMDGRVLSEIFDSPPRVESIPSWDEVEGEDGRHPPHFQFHPEDDRELMNQLVELGYVEEQDEDKDTAQRKSLRELQFNLARAYVDGDRHAESIPILEQLVEDWPGEYRFLNQLAYSYLSMERVEEARRSVEKLIAVQKRTREKTTEEISDFQEEMGETPTEEYSKEALDRLEKMKATWQQACHPPHMLLGAILSAEGRTEKALETLLLIPEESWSTPFIPMRLGLMCLELDRLNEALEYLEKALSMDPQNAKVHQLLMRYHMKKREFQAAAEQGLKAVGLRYFFPVAHHQLGRALVKLKRYENAVDAFKVAISQAPGFLEARQDLAETYQRFLKMPKKADEHFRIANEIIQKRGGASLEREEPEDMGITCIDISQRTEIPEEWTDDEITTIVSGLPRSGTSMVMQMLHAGGMECLTDGLRKPDENNPRGFFELEGVKELHRDEGVLNEARGKVVKIVAPILPKLPVGKGEQYRVIFIERDPDEVHASQAAMLKRLGKEPSPVSRAKMKQSYLRLLGQVNQHLEENGIPTMSLKYGETVESPLDQVKKLNHFCGGDLDELAMAKAVDPMLHREKSPPVQ